MAHQSATSWWWKSKRAHYSLSDLLFLMTPGRDPSSACALCQPPTTCSLKAHSPLESLWHQSKDVQVQQLVNPGGCWGGWRYSSVCSSGNAYHGNARHDKQRMDLLPPQQKLYGNASLLQSVEIGRWLYLFRRIRLHLPLRRKSFEETKLSVMRRGNHLYRSRLFQSICRKIFHPFSEVCTYFLKYVIRYFKKITPNPVVGVVYKNILYIGVLLYLGVDPHPQLWQSIVGSCGCIKLF